MLTLSVAYGVYVDKAGLPWDATLNQTSSAANSNKFYRLQLLTPSAPAAASAATTATSTDFICWTRWGRVGETGQSASFCTASLDEARASFEAKFRAKTGLAWQKRFAAPLRGKYTFLDRQYESDDGNDSDSDGDGGGASASARGDGADTASRNGSSNCSLSPPLQNVVAFIFNAQHMHASMAAMGYDAQKLPLGKLGARTLRAGFELLQALSAQLAQHGRNGRSGRNGGGGANSAAAAAAAMAELSDAYFGTIPHNFGRRRPPVLDSAALIKRETDLLESLADMAVADKIMRDAAADDSVHPLDRQFARLGMAEMTPCT